MPLFSPALNPASPFGSVRGDHAGVRVPDLEAALAWYGEKLDFRHTGGLAFDGITYGFLAPANDDGFQIELLAGPGGADRPPHRDLHDSLGLHGWHHVCLRVDSVDAALAELKRRAVRIVADRWTSRRFGAASLSSRTLGAMCSS